MFTKNKNKITLIAAVLLCAIFAFSACTTNNAFKPVDMPASTEVSGNGGVAVRVGEWIYYVNGYQSSYEEVNTYIGSYQTKTETYTDKGDTDDENDDKVIYTDYIAYTGEIRTAQIVRIKIDELEKIIKINDQDATTTQKTNAIKRAVAGKASTPGQQAQIVAALQAYVKDIKGAEVVIPNYYYTGNTTTTSLNGIYVFGERIYITTPNNALDANGNVKNSELALVSYKLDGSDMKTHFVFPSNAPQLKLEQNGSKIEATYILNSKLCKFSFAEGETVSDSEVFYVENDVFKTMKYTDMEKAEADEEEKQKTDSTYDKGFDAVSVSSPKFTDEYVYFQDGDGSICRYAFGASDIEVVVKKEVEEGHEDHSHGESYTIQSVNGEYVYYTTTDSSSQTAGLQLFYATSSSDKGVALAAIPDGSYYGWEDKVVYTLSETVGSTTIYGIWVASGNGTDAVTVLNPAENDSSITFNKIEGDILYYSANSVSYKLNLKDAWASANSSGDKVSTVEPVAYAYSLSTSNTGWSVADVLEIPGSSDSYVFTLSADAVSVVKYNSATKRNSTSTALTLTAIDD